MLNHKLFKYSKKELEKILNIKNIYAAKYIINNDKTTIYERIRISEKYFYYKLLSRDTTHRFPLNELARYYLPLTISNFNIFYNNNKYKLVNDWSNDKMIKYISKVFIDYFGTDRVDVNNKYITIYFLEIIIKNSFDQQHTIRDLYLTFEIYGSRLYWYKLNRTTYTKAEILNKYMYSHVSSRYISCYDSSDEFLLLISFEAKIIFL